MPPKRRATRGQGNRRQPMQIDSGSGSVSRKRRQPNQAGPQQMLLPLPAPPLVPQPAAKRQRRGENHVPLNRRSGFREFLANRGRLSNENIKKYAMMCKRPPPGYKGQRGTTRPEHIDWILHCGSKAVIDELLERMKKGAEELVHAAENEEPDSYKAGKKAAEDDKKANASPDGRRNNDAIVQKLDKLIEMLLAANTSQKAEEAVKQTNALAKDVMKRRSIPVHVGLGGYILRLAGIPIQIGDNITAYKGEIPLPDLPEEMTPLVDMFWNLVHGTSAGIVSRLLAFVLGLILGPGAVSAAGFTTCLIYSLKMFQNEYWRFVKATEAMKDSSKYNYFVLGATSFVRIAVKTIAFYAGYYGPAAIVSYIYNFIQSAPGKLWGMFREFILKMPGTRFIRHRLYWLGLGTPDKAYEMTLSSWVVDKWPYLHTINTSTMSRREAAAASVATREFRVELVSKALGFFLAGIAGFYLRRRRKQGSVTVSRRRLLLADMQGLSRAKQKVLRDFGFIDAVPLHRYNQILSTRKLTTVQEAKVKGAYLTAAKLVGQD